MEDERATVRDSAKFDTSAGEKKMVARHRGNEFKKKWNKNKKETKIRNGHEEEENENRFFVPASRSSPRASPKEKCQKKKQNKKTKRIKLDKKKHGN